MGDVANTPAPTPTPVSAFIARWDLDKTYLRTDFDTARDLLRTALERPDQKRSVPGAAALLREIGKTGVAHVHILSGSPSQMRGKLTEKLRIDRCKWDELTLKPNVSNLLRLRLRALHDQLGYKLPALLGQRVHDQALAPGDAREFLVGDDAEADAFVYSLYADVCAGTISENELRKIVTAGKVYADRKELLLRAARGVHKTDPVRRILIHLDRQSPPSHFARYGERVVPFYNYFQAGLLLLHDRFIGPEAVLRLGTAFVTRFHFSADSLARSYVELCRRFRLREDLLSELAGAFEAWQGVLGAAEALSAMLEQLGQGAHRHIPSPSLPPPLDYEHLAKEYRAERRPGRRVRVS